ncbi:Spo0B domain-containing protein [Sporolactobacillus spathodeae]|uniref:Stage 0 sporulation protein B (Sporulation initiation phosphotransferase) n=1 Tax=Sporolactobacillus spathodeae TaxID=1465502 RepID=A0ABS2Q6L7_9BACL|nr:Spo0B domain-containing protein [Sporolactobacillus spathodeae]MBM7657439.1 stage 0 sporulation protein B (sporulation initiation phosphotransferase) [Sporolactobacillus spathodeae]
MITEEEGVKIISSARHVLLNQLQLIKGYLYMQKTQKANEIIDQITEQLREQARLSRLNLPKVTFFLTTAVWSALPFQIAVHVAEGLRPLSEAPVGAKRLSIIDEQLTMLFAELLTYFKQYASELTDNFFDLYILNDTSGLQIKILYSGALQQKEAAFATFREKLLNDSFPCEEHYIEENEEQKMRWNLCLSIK